MLSSARSWFGEQTEETAATHDIVLDVEQIRRWASSVGRHVTSVAVEGAIHDVVLSRPEVRAQAYDVLDTWLGAVLGAVMYLASRRYAPAEEEALATEFGTAWEEYLRSVRVPWL